MIKSTFMVQFGVLRKNISQIAVWLMIVFYNFLIILKQVINLKKQTFPNNQGQKLKVYLIIIRKQKS